MSGALPAVEGKRAFVRGMFDRIAPRYDRMNRLMTLGLDQGWRRAALAAAGVGPGDRVVDLACGTGDLLLLARERGARAIGVDLARGMLRAARARERKLALVHADAVGLPLPDGWASAVTCGFALRNFTDLDGALREVSRLLAPGGRFIVLEVDRPRAAWLRAGHAFHMNRVVPRLGAWLADAEAYRYLPASFGYLPSHPELVSRLCGVGLRRVAKHTHLFGAAQRVIAWKA